MTKMMASQAFWAGLPRDIACVAVIGAGAMGVALPRNSPMPG